MFLFSLIGVCVVIYFLIQFLVFYFLDCDLELYILSKVGKPVGNTRELYIAVHKGLINAQFCPQQRPYEER